jgi:hypothetical protein
MYYIIQVHLPEDGHNRWPKHGGYAVYYTINLLHICIFTCWLWYSSTPLTSTLDGVVVNATPRPLYPWERPSIHCIRGWVFPRAGLDECGKSRPHRDSIPGPSSP